ncbi:MAG: double-stranded RNA binding motif domain-containing protein [Patescibacteria group bacterium]
MGRKPVLEHTKWRDELSRLCGSCKWELPRYSVREIDTADEPKFSATCRVFVDGYVLESSACNARRKKIACQRAAQNMLTILRRFVRDKQLYGETDLFYQDDPLSVFAFRRDMELPHYTYSGPHDGITAVGTFRSGNESVRGQAVATTRQAARAAASREMMKQLPFF